MRHDRVKYDPTLAPNIHSRIVNSFNDSLDHHSESFKHVGLYSRAMKFKSKYQKAEWLSKYDDGRPEGAEDRKSKAIAKWRLMEQRNLRTNVRFHARQEAFFKVADGVLSSERILSKARAYVESVIGDEPELEVLYGTFSNGASTGFSRDEVAAKFMVGADVTSECYPWICSIMSTCDAWKLYRGPWVPTIVIGGSLFTVPKNSEIDRCAIKEPELNMFCQKGAGDFIRSRMRSVKRIDLNDQTVNQQLARIGSVDGSLATLDLSSASDLLSQELVRALLPSAWYSFLDDIRSHACVIEDEIHELNMFSSMGNGFTWELESLIFAALASSVSYCTGSRGRMSVYGDDIIVPSSSAGVLAKVLQFCGLRVNTSKSHWTGPFRESCGRHWYTGFDVTPFYVKEPISSLPRLIHFLNRLRVWAEMPTMKGTCDPSFWPVYAKWMRYVPTSLYGGRDTNRIDALVTRHQPRMILVAKRNRRQNRPVVGAYLHWLRSADGRTQLVEPLVTSTVVRETQELTLRRSKALRTEEIITFPEEWGE